MSFLTSVILAASVTCPPPEIKLCDKCKLSDAELAAKIVEITAVCKKIASDRCLVWLHMDGQNPPQFTAHCKQWRSE